MSRTKGILACIAVCLSANAWAVNKCVGADGRVMYQDLPCTAESKSAPVTTVPQRRALPPMNRASMPQLAEEDLRQRVLDVLKDPGSANFKDTVVVDGRAMCGLVNAKNSYGGYNGFRRFVVDADGVYWQGDGSAAVDLGNHHARRTYFPRASLWGCLP